MEIQFINITSFRGTSSNAEHYYARYAENAYDVQQALLESYEGQIYQHSHDKDLLFFPGKEDAEKLCLKDNRMCWGADVNVHPVTPAQVELMMKEGTIRFPSIEAIIRQARHKWPEAVLIFSLYGSNKRFRNWMVNTYENDKKAGEEVFEAILGPLRKEK